MSTFVRVGEIETDERRRASLGKVVEPNTRYVVERDENGTIQLVPAIAMTREEITAMLKRAVKQAEQGKTVKVDSSNLDEFFDNL